MDELRRAIRRATSRTPASPLLCGSAFKQQGRASRCSTRWCDYLPSPLDVPPLVGHHPTPARRSAAPRRRGRAVPRARVQDHVRLLDESGSRIRPRLLRADPAEATHVWNAPSDREKRIGRVLADARQPPRGPRGRAHAGEHRRRRRARSTPHRRHPLRPGPPASSWSRSTASRRRSSRWRSRRPRPRPTRTCSSRRSPEARRRGPHRSSGEVRRRDRAAPRSPGWASSTSRSSWTASSASSRWTPTSASRRSPTARRSARKSTRSWRGSCARPVATASSATWCSTSSPPAPAAGTSSSTRSSAARSRGSTSPPWTRASRRPSTTASWPGTPWWTFGPR